MTDDASTNAPTDAEAREDRVERASALGDWVVPCGTDAVTCPHCGQPFRAERYRDLHRGQHHPAQLDEPEIDAYQTALSAERDDLRRFRLLALGGLVALYFGFLIVYAVTTG